MLRVVIAFTLLLAAASTQAANLSGPSGDAPIVVAAQTTRQVNKPVCDRVRSSCYAGRTQTGQYGTRYVPPDVVRECEGAYRSCMSRR